MDDFELEIKKEFINEALINLEEAEGSFMELESTADSKPLLDKIFRLAHNLKGGSRAVGFGDVAEFTHQLENLVLKIQKSEVNLSADIVTILLRSNDRLVEMLSALKDNMSAKFNNSDLLEVITACMSGQPSTAEKPAVEIVTPPPSPELTSSASTSEVSLDSDLALPPADTFFSAEEIAEPPPVIEPVAQSLVPNTVQSEVVQSQPVPEATPTAATVANAPNPENATKDKSDEIIRVNLSRINLLNDYVGELIVLQSVIQQQATQSMNSQLGSSLMQMVKLSKDIQNLSMSLRMLPVKPLVQKLQRVVRDTARALDKQVVLEVDGEHLDVDKSVLDRLADPLIHILRNAVDHGLEKSDARQKAGKTIEGHIKLVMANEGNHLVVDVIDDGKGIDSEIIRKKALEKKLITNGQNLSEKQLINLIFHPGFSTKTETSEISGRGVGMDVVKTNVEKIGGQVEITTQVGKGSQFRMLIPLSLAVIEGLIVSTDQNRYVIPLNQVQETINLKNQKIAHSKLGIGSCFDLRGTVVPLLNIEEALGAKSANGGDQFQTALIINVRDQQIALSVKDILRAQQIVIKPLSNGIQVQNGWIGSCVLGDGLPALIISPVDLLDGKINRKLMDKTAGGAA